MTFSASRHYTKRFCPAGGFDTLWPSPCHFPTMDEPLQAPKHARQTMVGLAGHIRIAAA